MEPVLFYGVPHGCSFGSIVALEWLGQPYRLCRIDMINKDARYARFTPLEETPALLLENGETLTESLAILLHIAARGPERRLGVTGGPAGDRLNQMLAYLHTSMHGAFAPAWAAYKLEDNDPLSARLREMARESAAECYAYLQSILAKRDWLLGESRSIADAYLAGIARWGEDLNLFDLQKDYPALYSYLQKLKADPAVAFAHAIEDGKPAQTSGQFLGHVAIGELLSAVAA